MLLASRKATLPRPLVTMLSAAFALLLMTTVVSLCPADAEARGAKQRPPPRPETPISQEVSPGSPVADAVSQFGAQALDLLVLRPMGLIATAGGVGFFVLSSPLAAVSTATDFQTSWDIFVQAPWEFTTERPLGDL